MLFFLPLTSYPLGQFHLLFRLQLLFYIWLIPKCVCLIQIHTHTHTHAGVISLPFFSPPFPKDSIGISPVTQVRLLTIIFPSSYFCTPLNHPLVLFLYPLSNLFLLPTTLYSQYPESQVISDYPRHCSPCSLSLSFPVHPILHHHTIPPLL